MTSVKTGTRVGYTFNGRDYYGTVAQVTIQGENVWLHITPDAGQTDSVSAIIPEANVWETGNSRPERVAEVVNVRELPAGYTLHSFGRGWVVTRPDGTSVPNTGDWTSTYRPFGNRLTAIMAARRDAGLPTRRAR